MQRRSALDSSGVPPALLRATPRDVRVNASGRVMFLTVAALVIGGMWGGIVLSRRADIAERRLGLFASERVLTGGEITQLRKRGEDDELLRAHYRYTARGQEFDGVTGLRRSEHDRYVVGTPVAVWYLPSEPEQSWLDGYSPRGQPSWPATAVPIACGLTAFVLFRLVRRQSNLLTYGRPAMATVTNIEKKKTDKGTEWRVHYEWTTLSGATRTGKYQHGKKDLPALGALVPIVYDRDNSFRHSKYPMSLVTIRS